MRVDAPAPPALLEAEYVLPLAWDDDTQLDDLIEYLGWLATRMPVTVVDGSPAERYRAHAARFPPAVRHLPPEPWSGPNGKVAGVMTGIRTARHDRVVLADDDVRYDEAALDGVVSALAHADLVRPQNVFEPMPWHARWDTGRTLVNRAFGSDYPGTLGVRAAMLLDAGGYDGAALFENLELIRTLRAAGGREVRLDALGVARRPPTVGHFVGQRIRQAYDDFAQPARLALELALLPAALLASRRPALLLALAASFVALAEFGRRRSGGTLLFPADAAPWAPLWGAERSVCVWLAVLQRLRGGPRYRGQRMRLAAHSARYLTISTGSHA